MTQTYPQPHDPEPSRAVPVGGLRASPSAAQKGFTMVELLVVIGIAVAVTGVIAAAIITLVRLSPPSEAHAIALSQVQNTGHWLVLDINMASKVEKPGGEPATVVKLTQPRWDATAGKFVNASVTYKIQEGKLLREEQRAGEETVRKTTVAENVELAIYLPGDTNKPECCAQLTGTEPAPALCIEVTCQVRGVSGTNEIKRCYQATPRVVQQQTTP